MIRAASFILILALSPFARAASQTEPSLISDDAARLELARMLRDDKRVAESIAEYRQLIDRQPVRADLRLELAELYAACNDAASAQKILEPVKPDALGPRGQLLLANLAIQQNDFSRAEKLLRACLEKDPGNLAIRLQLADVLSWAKRYDEANAEMQRLVDARPNDVQLRRHYARLLGWAGRRADAIAQWKISLEAAKSAE